MERRWFEPHPLAAAVRADVDRLVNEDGGGPGRLDDALLNMAALFDVRLVAEQAEWAFGNVDPASPGARERLVVLARGLLLAERIHGTQFSALVPGDILAEATGRHAHVLAA